MIIPATLELLAYATDRAAMAAFLTSAGLATVDQATGDWIAAEGCQLHPFRAGEEIVVEHPTGAKDKDGNPVMERMNGFHCNLRFYGAMAESLSGGGLAKIATEMTRKNGQFDASMKAGHVPAGYQTASGVTIYLGEAVTRRRNVWA